MTATLHDIAERLGINICTVSRALNDKPGVGPKMRRRVTKVALEMGYRPNIHARSLTNKRTEALGFLSGMEISSFLSNAFYTGVFAGIESEARALNYALMFDSVAESLDLARGYMPKMLAEHRVDGLLVVGAMDEVFFKAIKASGHPFVVVDYHLPGFDMDTVTIDNRRGGWLATEHLIERGHRRIAFIGGTPLTHGNFAERLEGYQNALAAHGLPRDEKLVQEGEVIGGGESIMQILKRAPDVTAAVACNDINALNAITTLEKTGRQIPRDFSIAGFDDIQEAQTSVPSLTTIHIDRPAMGRKA
ncbi:MAG: LacI family DNA-binding transcriptional regulator, partial [Kiritimatiellae bacterium]|nr:LacI family DNA-binding transcriptional regulator [Kiritimatiellia bacterium]